MRPVAIPGHLHFDSPVFIAVDFAVGWAGDHRVLVTRKGRTLLLRHGRTKDHVPRRSDECVAIALAKIPAVDLSHGLLEHLGLFAFVGDVRQQPHVVPFFTWVPAQLEETPADQPRLITFTVGDASVPAVAFQTALCEVFAMQAVGKLTGVALLLQRGKRLAGDFALQRQAWLAEVVIAHAH